MNPLLRALALGIGPVVVVAGLGLGVVNQAGPINNQLAPPPPPPAAAACTQPPVFQTGYQRESNGVIPVGEGYKFNGLSWIQANLCSAGTLRITASGELAGDELPQLTVWQDDQMLAVLGFDQEQSVEVKVLHPGNVYLAYSNDYYLSDAREATISQLKFVGSDCQNITHVDVPRETGGNSDISSGSVSLTASVAMTVVPCEAGRFSLQVVGRRGNGAFPQLSFLQSGREIKSAILEETVQIVQMDVLAEPISIVLTNPYFKQLADRNLNVQKIEFIPFSGL